MKNGWNDKVFYPKHEKPSTWLHSINFHLFLIVKNDGPWCSIYSIGSERNIKVPHRQFYWLSLWLVVVWCLSINFSLEYTIISEMIWACFNFSGNLLLFMGHKECYQWKRLYWVSLRLIFHISKFEWSIFEKK